MTVDEPTPAQLQAAVEQLEAEMERGESASGPWIQAVRERALRLAAEERHAAQLDDAFRQRDEARWMHDEARKLLAAMRKRAEAAERARAVTQRHFDEVLGQRDTLRTEVDELIGQLTAERQCTQWARTEVARLTEALERERIERQAAEARAAQFEDEAWDELMGM